VTSQDGPAADGQAADGQAADRQAADRPARERLEPGRLALARGTVNRVTERRSDTAWLKQAWSDPRTRVLVVDDGRALVHFPSHANGRRTAELVLVPPAQAPAGVQFLLGQDGDGVVYFGVNAPLPASDDGAKPTSLRSVGALLADRDAGLMTHAVALANWHATHTHCPRCGTATVPEPAGDSTRCPKDGTEHFPRTDPAVIMLVTDQEDRCLLGRNAAWPERRFSILAGFVDSGESAEHAVVREVHEETGIAVENVRYLGSQPWPMPRSLMLGFRADAPDGQQITIDNAELAEARWFTRAELLASLQAKEMAIAPPVSIARAIIESWYGAELPD
jgi:NAD+ diphosphatase